MIVFEDADPLQIHHACALPQTQHFKDGMVAMDAAWKAAYRGDADSTCVNGKSTFKNMFG